MHDCDVSWLPQMMPVDFTNWGPYVDALYAKFTADFISNAPFFRGKRVGVDNMRAPDGKHARFWHVISEDDGTRRQNRSKAAAPGDEERNPDPRRCERLPWLRPMIADGPSARVLTWKDSTRGETRWGLSLSDFSFVVVVAERGRWFHLVTAFCVEQPRRREKFRDHYAQFHVP